MFAPKLSVVASAFNAERRLAESLESILRQESVDFEFIIVDDGSTDDTSRLLRQYAEQDSRIRLLRQENQGLTMALIAGCRLARGQFIARHDMDDISLPNRLHMQFEYLQKQPKVAFVSCWSEAVGPCGEFLYDVRYVGNPIALTDNLRQFRHSVAGHGSVMFRREHYEKVGGYRPQFYFAQDLDLWLRLADIGQYAIVPETLYRYCFDGASISGKYRNAQLALAKIIRELQNAAPAQKEDLLLRASRLRPGLLPASKLNRGAGSYFIARCLLRNRDIRARDYLLQSIRERPLQFRSYFTFCLSWVADQYRRMLQTTRLSGSSQIIGKK
jgi:glycosyltransferase involved in cell wall biosynthesis